MDSNKRSQEEIADVTFAAHKKGLDLRLAQYTHTIGEVNAVSQLQEDIRASKEIALPVTNRKAKDLENRYTGAIAKLEDIISELPYKWDREDAAELLSQMKHLGVKYSITDAAQKKDYLEHCEDNLFLIPPTRRKNITQILASLW